MTGIHSPESGSAPTVVLVEDSTTDVKITERALRLAGAHVHLVVLRDGEEAVRYFTALGEKISGLSSDPDPRPSVPGDARLSFPALTLLDLNLPRLSGLEVLEQVRAIPSLQGLPIVVLSTSSNPEDVRKAYRQGATTYFEKPHELQDFVQLLQILHRYWIQFAMIPHPCA